MDEGFSLNKKQIIVILGVALVSFGFYMATQAVIYFNLQYEKSLLEREDLTKIVGVIPRGISKNIELSAKAYLVWDMKKQKVLTSLNKEIQLPLASLTKLMTAYVVSGDLKNDSILTIQNKNLDTEGESGLVLGERWNLADMIDFTLMSSSNDGASALASVVEALSPKKTSKTFVEEMNETAKRLGMVQSFFLNESGLDVNESIGGAYGSAKDISILLEKILEENSGLVEATTQKEKMLSSDTLVHQAQNTNILIDKLPGVLASKTGFTDLAGGNLIMAFDMGVGHNIVIVVLGSTKEGRFSDMEKLFWATAESL